MNIYLEVILTDFSHFGISSLALKELETAIKDILEANLYHAESIVVYQQDKYTPKLRP